MGESIRQHVQRRQSESALWDRIRTAAEELRQTGRSRWQADQYGCHSDGRCLDDYDAWCDEAEWVELEGASGGSVCYETYEWIAAELAEDLEGE